MELQKIRAIAKEHGIKAQNTGKTGMIRAIQLAEGHQACFDTGKSIECGQDNCLWRGDCFTSTKTALSGRGHGMSKSREIGQQISL